jgi:hypothetical protein
VNRTVVILQSNYIPWKGYFDLIAMSDEFVLYDDAQYTKRDWRNRNRIKTRNGTMWLTIPVDVKGKYLQAIKDVRVAGSAWAREHWESIRHSYATAPCFETFREPVRELYESCQSPWLTEVNRHFLTGLSALFGVKPCLRSSSEFPLEGDATDKLVSMCRGAGGTAYVSGPAAKNYLEVDRFNAAGIAVQWMDYSHYPEYPQLFPPFEHGVTALDLLFHVGEEANSHLLGRTSPSDEGVPA